MNLKYFYNNIKNVAFIFLLFCYSLGYTQMCNTTTAIPVNGTFSVNGVNITSSSTGSVTAYSLTFTTCTGHTFSPGSYQVGNGAGGNPPNSASAWFTTFTFDKPVNNLVILIGATGSYGNENFIFNSNGGAVSISSSSPVNCDFIISGNQITSGINTGAAVGGGGVFTIKAPTNFTSLTINGAGGYNGSLMAFCSASIVPAPTISIAPVSQDVCTNSTPTTISATATGTGTLSYNWYRNTTNSSSGWTLINGATSANYVPPTNTAGTMYYYAVVTDVYGTSTASNVSQVNVISCIDPCVPSPTNPDSDGDGIADACDWDDDNDGILDRDECIGYIANNVSGPWKGRTASNVTVSASPSMTQPNDQFIQIDPQVNFSVNRNGGDQRFGNSATSTSFVLTFSTPVPANEIGLMIDDVNVAANQSPNASFKIEVDFGAGFVIPNGVFMKTMAGRNGGVGYNALTGVPSFQDLPNPVGEDIYLKGAGNRLIKAVRITGSNLGSGDSISYSFFALAKCDTDGDGIPNDLDLDSDGDGCFDAIEGAENVTQAHLNNLGNIRTNAAGVANGNNIATVDANGVPLLVNSGGVADTGTATVGSVGQPIGSSQNSAINPCCTNPPTTGTPDGYTKTGISDIEGFIGGTAGWPNNVPNGFIAIESKNKGFVITRVSSSAAITNPVEGMLIYDIEAACVKLYNGSFWKCLAKDCLSAAQPY